MRVGIRMMIPRKNRGMARADPKFVTGTMAFLILKGAYP